MPQEVGPGEFFDLVFHDAPEGGFVTLATFPGNGKFSHDAGPTEQLWFEWPGERDIMVSTAEKHRTKDIYLCPVVFAKKSRKSEHAQWLGVVYADADSAQPEVFRTHPSITVESSPGRFHLYWLVQDNGNPLELAKVAKSMAYAHADEGCDTGGWDLSQLLRVPGTANNKPKLGKPHLVRARSSGLFYTYESLTQHYSPDDVVLPQPAQHAGIPEDLPEYADAYAKAAHDNKIVELLRVQGRAPTKTSPGNRSELLWALSCACAEAGVDRKSTFVLGWQVAYNKYRVTGRPQALYWREICKAYDYIGIPEEAEEQEQEEDTTPDEFREHKEKHRPLAVHLLTEKERRLAPPTFVDQYVGWAGSKTDAAKQYHEAAALTILGCVFGEFGLPSTKYDGGFLNQWFMVLGGTTMSRKSTVRSMMTKFLRNISDEQYFYDLGSNVTPEGLHNELLDRDGLSSLFHRDEVHGMFSEEKHKHYLSGLREMLTELYDGSVQGKLRATGMNTKSRAVETCFNMYMTGVTEHVTESLTRSDFESGHLARFLYIYADPPPINKKTVYIEQAEERVDERGLHYEERDRPYELLLKQIRDGRDHWLQRVGGRGKQVRVFWEKNAWDRLNKARLKAMLWAHHHPRYSDILEATMQRSMHQVLKIATLLAMADQVERVQMKHLYRALKFAEQSFTHLELILDRIVSTDRTKLMDKIVHEVLNAGEKGITTQKLYNKFRDECPSEQLKPHLTDLQAAGQIKIDQQRVYALEVV